MKRLTIKIIIALLTFTVGVGATAAWIAHSRHIDLISPVPLPDPNAHQNPTSTNNRPTLEMVFVLDTTGSMSGLLEGAKQRIWGIVNDVMKSQTRPAVRIGLVAYRDIGDEYVTRLLPLTSDLDQVYTTLMAYRADGGGDTPENVRRALADGVRRAGWSQSSENLAQIIFLVGDAPPHDDYVNEPSTTVVVAEAVKRGMIVNAIQCGNQAETTQAWQLIASRGEGQYLAIAQDGGVQAIATPFDNRLAELGSRLGGTFVAYGGGAAGAEMRTKVAAHQILTEDRISAEAPAAASAERAINKAINSKAYAGDLMQSLENGAKKLEDVRKDDLPEELQKLSDGERRQEIEKKLAERRSLRAEILTLSKQRDEFVSAERKKQAGAPVGFDAAVAEALKKQLLRKKIQL